MQSHNRNSTKLIITEAVGVEAPLAAPRSNMIINMSVISNATVSVIASIIININIVLLI